MSDLPADWGALCALALLLGARHGLDADHLAAIDGLTRVAARRGEPHARWCGSLFSLGHGAVVMAIALAAGAWGAAWVPPGWFNALGAAVSIGFLGLIGIVNLHAVLKAPRHAPVPLVGVRGRVFRRLLGGERRPGPGAVAGVGALFALSFDTVSQAALFAVMAVPFGGVGHALVLGLLFTLGMMASDGANGWWISRLIARTDRRAAAASRTMTLAVAGVSLAVAALGAARLASGWVDGRLAGRELVLGGAVILSIALAYAVACRAGTDNPA